MTRILCVCLGNICRSPTAEAVLRAMAPHLVVDSAGTSDWNIGSPPYRPAVRSAARRGYDLSPLRARQVRTADFFDFDLILAMDRENLIALEHLRPENATATLRLLMDHAPRAGASEVPDPYNTRDFDGALDLIEQASKGLIASL